VHNRASAIGAAATATLAGWLTGAPGAAPVGGAPGVTPLTVTAPPHTVVSLPQLLAQTTDAAPWATWGIGIAGGLLSAAAAWRTATGGALPADAGRIASHVDDIGRIAGRVDDAGRAADALADAGRAADALTDAGRTAGTAAGKAASHADDAAGLAGRIRITPDDVDPLRLRTLEARRRALGTDSIRGYLPYEGEVGALIEDWFGGLRRSPHRGADWIGTSGSYEGKTVDLIGLPRGASAFHSDNMENFLPAIDDHFLKSVDYIVLDVRFMTPAQKETVLRHINARWASEKSRLILVE